MQRRAYFAPEVSIGDWTTALLKDIQNVSVPVRRRINYYRGYADGIFRAGIPAVVMEGRSIVQETSGRNMKRGFFYGIADLVRVCLVRLKMGRGSYSGCTFL